MKKSAQIFFYVIYIAYISTIIDKLTSIMKFDNLKRNQDPQHTHLLGKKVSLLVEGQEWVGNLTFSGKNTFLNGQLQVTLDKTPLKVTQNELNNLKLV